MKTIQIERNGNVVAIKPDFGKRTLITFLNGKKVFGFKLNSDNQFVSKAKKVGVQLTPGQVELIRKWEKKFEESREREDNEKIKKIKTQAVKTLSFKYGTHLLERYMHTEHVSIKGKYVYSEEGERLMEALRSFSREQLQDLGIKSMEGIWQEIALTKEDKKYIVEQGAKNLQKMRKEREKDEKEKKEKKAAIKHAAKEKERRAFEKAVQTGEKQILSTVSTLGNDANLIIRTKYIHPNSSISHEEFHDNDM